MKRALLCGLATVAACNASNTLTGAQSFPIAGTGSTTNSLDGGLPQEAHIYMWGNVLDGGDVSTVCGEVTPTGPISSQTVPQLVAINLEAAPDSLAPGSFAIDADGGTNTATVIVSLGANGNQPDAVWYATSGSISVTSFDQNGLSGTFQTTLIPLGATPDGGPSAFSGAFSAPPCHP